MLRGIGSAISACFFFDFFLLVGVFTSKIITLAKIAGFLWPGLPKICGKKSASFTCCLGMDTWTKQRKTSSNYV